MNTRSFEQKLQQIDSPVPDPQARLRARRAALAEFERLHEPAAHKSGAAGWPWNRQWLGGFATACVAVAGVSIYWLMPEQEREIRRPGPAEVQVAPAAEMQQDVEQVPEDMAGPAVPPQAVEARVIAAVPPAPPTPPVPPRQASTGTGSSASISAGTSANAGTSASARSSPSTIETTGAKTRDDELVQMQVAGRRIPPEVTSADPVVRISNEELQRLGIVNVADTLAQLVPQNISTYKPTEAGDNLRSGAAGRELRDRDAFFIGNTIANLRGMDPAFASRTLTLVDGRRVVSTAGRDGLISQALILSPGAAGDRFEHYDTNPAKRAAEEPVSTFSVDVDTTSYSFTRRMLNDGMLPPPDAVRAEEMINYFDYAWPAPSSRRQPFRPTVTVSDSPWGEGRKLVHVGIKGYELPARGKPDVNLVLLLDISGSMDEPDRLPLAKRSMKLLLDSLKPTDTVAIVVYAGAAGEVLAPTPVRDRETIEQALDNLRAGGSTAGAQGIRLAYQLAERNFRKDGVNRILLATDGDFNVGVASPDELNTMVQNARTRGIYLSVLGFGRGNYRDDIAQTLAQNGNGVAAYIDTFSEARKVLAREATSSMFTIASDVKIQVEFNPATVAEYRLVGYETRALNREDFNNDKVDAGDVGSGHSVTAIYEIAPVGSGAALIDARRYASETSPAAARGKANEYGFVKIRYKLPGEERSQLLEEPIRIDAGVPRALRQDVAFSTAVAGFAQLLRGGQYTGALGYDEVIRQARSATGEDPYGYRAEFIGLVGHARDAQPAAESAAD